MNQSKVQNEVTVKPSQWLNVIYFLLPVIGVVIHTMVGLLLSVIPIYKYVEFNCWSWTLLFDSLIERKGVFNVTTDEIEFFRIKDVRLYEPILFRLVGLSTLTIVTSDKMKPKIVLRGITNGEQKRSFIKASMMISRRKEGVREFDFS